MSLWGKWRRAWLLVSLGMWQQWLWMCFLLERDFCSCVRLGRGKVRAESKFVTTNPNIATWITQFQLFVPKEYLQNHQISVGILIILCFLTLVVKAAFILPFHCFWKYFFIIIFPLKALLNPYKILNHLGMVLTHKIVLMWCPCVIIPGWQLGFPFSVHTTFSLNVLTNSCLDLS